MTVDNAKTKGVLRKKKRKRKTSEIEKMQCQHAMRFICEAEYSNNKDKTVLKAWLEYRFLCCVFVYINLCNHYLHLKTLDCFFRCVLSPLWLLNTRAEMRHQLLPAHKYMLRLAGFVFGRLCTMSMRFVFILRSSLTDGIFVLRNNLSFSHSHTAFSIFITLRSFYLSIALYLDILSTSCYPLLALAKRTVVDANQTQITHVQRNVIACNNKNLRRTHNYVI